MEEGTAQIFGGVQGLADFKPSIATPNPKQTTKEQ
jgi:hypothetical protein